MGDIALAKSEVLFVKKEVTKGVLITPVAGDVVRVAGVSEIPQESELIDDEQKRNARSRLSPILGRVHPGTFRIPTYIKPSGALGTKPEASALLEGLLGKETVDAGVKVEYTLLDDLSSYSIWVKKGHTVFMLSGAVVNEGAIGIAGNAIGTIEFSGFYMKQLWTGTDTLKTAFDGTGSPVTQITVDNPKRFSVGSIIEIGADDNGGDGYVVSAVNYVTGVLTLATGCSTAQVEDAAIAPWLPVTTGEVGAPVHGKLGYATVGGVDTVILTSSITIANNVKLYEDEKNNTRYAEDYGAPTFREVTGSIDAYFTKAKLEFFKKHFDRTQDAIIIPIGNVAGKIMEVSLPRTEWDSPTLSGDEEITEGLGFRAVADSADLNSEIKLTYK